MRDTAVVVEEREHLVANVELVDLLLIIRAQYSFSLPQNL